MIISDNSLKRMIDTGEIVVTPLDEKSIQPASIDCRLGNEFLLLEEEKMEIIELDKEVKYKKVIADEIVIPAHSFILATTQEYIEIPDNVISFVEGRSSIGRIGLFVENAGWVDPGFKGNITLELYNASPLPIKVQAGKRICQLVFGLMDRPADSPYRGKYQGQRTTKGSEIFKDIDRIIKRD